MQEKQYSGRSLPSLSRILPLFLLFLLFCGTASAELVYTVLSDDYSIGRVNYSAGGAPQNANVLEGIKASGLYFGDVFSTDKGEWRVLTQTTSHDATGTYSYSYSLYNPDGNWKSPLGKAENLRRSGYHRDDNSLYFVSGDNSSYTITKLDRETLTETAKSSEPMKGYPQFGYLKEEGIIYSRYYDSEKPSLTLLDKDLKGKTFALDAGDYDYMASLGDGSLAMSFVSEDVQEFVDEEGISHSTSTLKDLGIFKFTTSAKTRIVTSADLGFSASDTWGSIWRLTSDKSGGLYFVAHKSGSSALYHWDGSKLASVYKANDGESIETFTLDSNGNVYCHVSKSVWNEQTQLATITTSLYRVGTSAPVYKEEYTGNDAGVESIQRDSSGNIYFAAYKSSGNPTSRALWRCGASQTTATKLHEETDGSWIDYFWMISSSSSSNSSGSESRFYDDSGNAYFTVSSGDVRALYRCGASATSATKLHGVTDGSYISSFGMDESSNIYFTVEKSTWNPETHDTTYTSSALYRCGPSATSPTPIHSVTDGSFIIVSDVSEAGTKGVYFAVVKRKEETERREDGSVVYTSYYPSYAYWHYDGTNAKVIHTFSDVSEPDRFSGVSGTDRVVDEKHEVLYLYASPRSSDLGSTLLAFDNADRHNPDLLETFELDGRIGSPVLYNHIVTSSSEESGVVEPQPSSMTDEQKQEAIKTIVETLRAGGNEEAAKTFENTPLASNTEIENARMPVTETEVQALQEAAKSEMARQGRTVRAMSPLSKMKFDSTRLVFLDITLPDSMQPGDLLTFFKNAVANGTVLLAADDSDATVFLNSSRAETKVVPVDRKVTVVTVFEGGTTYQPIVVASTSSSNVTSNKGSGGCDAGFGALALAALAAGAFLKKRGK